MKKTTIKLNGNEVEIETLTELEIAKCIQLINLENELARQWDFQDEDLDRANYAAMFADTAREYVQFWAACYEGFDFVI